MSWLARKMAGLDSEDIKQIEEAYWQAKEKERLLMEQEVKKFWSEYEEEYYNG